MTNKLKDKKSNCIFIIHKGNNVIGYKNTIDEALKYIDEALKYIDEKTTELEQNSRVYSISRDRLSYSEITFLED